MTCPVCNQPAATLKSAVLRGELMSDRCNRCVSSFVPSSMYAAKYKRDRMRDNHRGDLVQAYNGDKPSKEFARLYPDRAMSQFGKKFMETV